MTPQERSSIANGIWLCSDCATDIDVDRFAYPTPLLMEWKATAERRASEEKGRRLPEPDDARSEVLAVLTGTTPKFTRGAISNTHAAVQQLLNKMDPRLKVETSFVDGAVHFGIHARENVNFRMRFPADLADQWRSGLRDVADHGREVRLPANGLQVTGSPIFDLLLDTNSLVDAHLTIGPSLRKKAVQKLRLVDPATEAIEQFDDISGSFTFGRKSMTFEGEACGGALATSMTTEIREERPWKSVFGLTLHFDCWEGVDLEVLPYFEKLQVLIERIRAGWRFEIELEIEGRSIGRARTNLNDPGAFDSVAGVLAYVSMMRTIAAYVNARIAFSCDTTISNKAFDGARDVSDRIKGKRVFGPEICPVSMTLTADGDNVQRLLSPMALVVAVIDDDRRHMRAFGQQLTLPRTRIDIVNFQARVAAAGVDVSAVKDGDAVPIELLPADGFRFTERYLRSDEPAELGPNDLVVPSE